jgi:chromosome segregation protein
MDITRLTIHGFKSFYDKSVFTFGKRITAIVGPNGSGKSNITEAIRFVLGEQGVKAMRGKDITDMLFRGGSVRASKAKAEIVFTNLNPQNFKINSDNIFVKNSLEKEEVIVSRTVFADGKSIYEMNGVEVRLKDIQEFLLHVHLGNKSSWHISQGEADRVLSANALERKTLIEDALGLKIYHARINESQKKLEKTKENIREASLQRKEILPELSMLSRTVEKIKRAHEFRQELAEKSSIFLQVRKDRIFNLKVKLQNYGDLQTLQNSLHKLDQEIGQMQAALNKVSDSDEELLQKEKEKEEKVLRLVSEKERTLKQENQEKQNILNYSQLEESKVIAELQEIDRELAQVTSSGNDIIFSEADINTTKGKIESGVERILNNTDWHLVREAASEVDLNFKKMLTKGSIVTKDNLKQISYLQSVKTRLQEKLKRIHAEKIEAEQKLAEIAPVLEQETIKISLSSQRISDLQKQILEFKYLKVEREKDVQNKIFERSNLLIFITESQNLTEKILQEEKELQQELWDFENILGKGYALETASPVLGEEEYFSLRRQIERLKVKIEESMVSNPDEVLNKHKDLSERDAFLIKEIEDLEKSITNLDLLINDLKQSLTLEFDKGLEQINLVFDGYVKKLFGGGGAKVFVVEIENKRKSDDSLDEEIDQETKTGVDVEVEIPKKKIKGLHSLSGGERALVSIALNFSIINQNPSPFMILDETDAALDEANSKRYGEMLEMLKQKTKLIVVTHNRETMHFADQIFGVTLHKDGHSKVLSVSFDDAIEYAK